MPLRKKASGFQLSSYRSLCGVPMILKTLHWIAWHTHRIATFLSFTRVMTIVISQLHLIGFNTTCDFKKSQFANGLSCISLQQSHNFPIDLLQLVFFRFDYYATYPKWLNWLCRITSKSEQTMATIEERPRRKYYARAHCSWFIKLFVVGVRFNGKSLVNRAIDVVLSGEHVSVDMISILKCMI